MKDGSSEEVKGDVHRDMLSKHLFVHQERIKFMNPTISTEFL